jgi:hypothetical protein
MNAGQKPFFTTPNKVDFFDFTQINSVNIVIGLEKPNALILACSIERLHEYVTPL